MAAVHGQGAGLGIAVVSAAAFSTSGSFASSLIDAGWSPAAAVLARIVVAAIVLTVPALVALRGRRGLLVHTWRSVTTFGVVAVAGSQLCFFNAVEHLSVGVALLLEYLGVLLVVGWMWLRHGLRPGRLTLAGAGAAVVGLILVLDVTGGRRLAPAGIVWGLGAAVGLAVYFVLSAETHEVLPPVAMAWATMTVGGICLVVLAAAGVLPMRATSADVHFLHREVSWLVPVLGLALVAAAFAYVCGIQAARLLGAKLSSFVGLSEVLFAVLFAWLLLGQLPGPVQILGGVFIVAGVALVRVDGPRPAPVPVASWPAAAS
jgi:drug/metabolite transporter (DMT)-like permease